MARRIFDSEHGNEINGVNNINANVSQEVNKEHQESEFQQRLRELSKDEALINTLKVLNENRHHIPIINFDDMPKSSQERRIEELEKKLNRELEIHRKFIKKYYGTR